MLNGLMMPSILRKPEWVYIHQKHPNLWDRLHYWIKNEDVITMSRWHLKCLQDGTLQDYTRVVNSGVVGGKL